MAKHKATITCETVDHVVAALGGISEVARYTGRGNTAVHNWIARGMFPSSLYWSMTRALEERREQALPILWGQEEAAAPRIAA